MEPIEEYLKDDEKILFQRSLINPANKKNIKAMFIIAGISLFLIIPIIIFLIIGLNFIQYFIISILLIITSVILGLFSLGLYLPYYRYRKVLQFSFNQIKRYKDIYVLTNKRWIQKCFTALSINQKTFPVKAMILKDIISIDFDQISSFFSQREDSYKSYFIGFDIKFPYGQGLFIPYEIFPEFIKVLKEIIKIKKEIHSKHGLIYYYRE